MSNLNELKLTISLNPFARFCCTIGNLPSSYMASLTYEEQLLWFCDYLQNTVIPAVNNNAEVVKELQELYVELKNYVDNYFENLDVQEEINNKLDEMAQDGTLEKIIMNAYANFWVNPEWFGAKFDGITDDSKAIEEAIKMGNVKFPHNKHVLINNTIICNNSERIIDLNECYLSTSDNILMFQINDRNSQNALINFIIKNGFIKLNNGGKFIDFHECYFTKTENIRISGLKLDNIALNYRNGFNHNIDNVNINGSSSNINNVSTNNAIGIQIETETPTTFESISNITNFIVKNCLIQRCQFGIKLKGNINSTFDTNKFINIGFSYCDYAFYSFIERGHIYNLDIDTIRAEYCDYIFYNNGFISVGNLYCYKCQNPIYNNNGIINFNKNITFFGEENSNIINFNNRVLDFSNVQTLLRDKYSIGNFENGKIIPSNFKNYRNTNENVFDRLITSVIPIDKDFNFSLLNNFLLGNGNKVIITGDNANVYSIPNIDGTIKLYQNNFVEFYNNNGVIEISQNGSILVGRTLTTTEHIMSFINEKIAIYKATANIYSLNANRRGLMIIYSTTENITLANGNNAIKNFPSEPINLYNNPILLYSDGEDNIYIISK